MTRLFAQLALSAALWIALPVTAAAQTAPDGDREIHEAVVYRDSRHVFLASRNGKFDGHSGGAWTLAGEPVDRNGARGSDAGAVKSDPPGATESTASITAPDDERLASQIDAAPDRTLLDYIALGLLFFIAVWAIAYRREHSRDTDGSSAKDRAEALDARLTYVDQRLADIERRIRKQPHHMKAA